MLSPLLHRKGTRYATKTCVMRRSRQQCIPVIAGRVAVALLGLALGARVTPSRSKADREICQGYPCAAEAGRSAAGVLTRRGLFSGFARRSATSGCCTEAAATHAGRLRRRKPVHVTGGGVVPPARRPIATLGDRRDQADGGSSRRVWPMPTSFRMRSEEPSAADLKTLLFAALIDRIQQLKHWQRPPRRPLLRPADAARSRAAKRRGPLIIPAERRHRTRAGPRTENKAARRVATALPQKRTPWKTTRESTVWV